MKLASKEASIEMESIVNQLMHASPVDAQHNPQMISRSLGGVRAVIFFRKKVHMLFDKKKISVVCAQQKLLVLNKI